MTCQEFWNEMPELETIPEQLEHARQCAACAALLRDQRALAAGLTQIARDRFSQEAPSRVEARLLKAFRDQAGRGAASSASRGPVGWWMWVPAAAAVIVLAVFLVRGHRPDGTPGDLGAAQIASEQAGDDGAASDSEFLPVPYASSDDLAEEADLVSVEVPRSALVALGLPMAADGVAARVQAVVALSADGVVEGVRLVQ